MIDNGGAKFTVPDLTRAALRAGKVGLRDLDELRDGWVVTRNDARREAYYTRMRSTEGLTAATKVKVRGRINSMLKKFRDEETSAADAVIKSVLAEELAHVRNTMCALDRARLG